MNFHNPEMYGPLRHLALHSLTNMLHHSHVLYVVGMIDTPLST